MKDSLQAGLQSRVELTVDTPRTIDFMGDDLRVYATPQIVNDLEYACRNLILEHLDDGEDTVGAKVEIEHAKPTPLGFKVTHVVTVESVDRRRVICRVEVQDEIETVATATHTRFVVDVARLKSAIQDKQSQKGD
ncbi:MAG: thioesterase family protein [Hyphomicrobiaceae bacterium]